MFLFLYFGVLVLALAVIAGVMSWPWALLLGITLVVIERRIISVSHITDGDDASDEHGKFRETHGH